MHKLNAFPAGSRSGRQTGDSIRWMQIAHSLLQPRPTTCLGVLYGFDGGNRRDETSIKAFVRVLERPTETTALVLWRSAARCHYGEQLWIRGVAKRAGSCAVSGQAVKRGDRIYRPRQGRARISNSLAVILATFVETDARGLLKAT
jgi:Domain of unknown function (DUF3331)